MRWLCSRWFDKLTGQATAVGQPFGVAGMMDFTYDSDGTLYGATMLALYRIDTETGVATLVFNFGGDIILSDTSRRNMGIHFAPDGTLYATDFVPASLGGSSLYHVDLRTGAGTRIGYTGWAQVHSAEMPPPTPAARIAALGSNLRRPSAACPAKRAPQGATASRV